MAQDQIHIDFQSSKLLYRCKHASLKKELLARAMGIHPKDNPVIMDSTAGLGRDSFILAYLGYNVTLVERSPILHALLVEAMDIASKNQQIAPIIQRMRLIHANSIDWLPSQPQPDIIYLDPMFPERKKSASVKKEMVLLQDLLGNDMDSAQLLQVALTCARRRVVVKRPRLADRISDQEPSFTLAGKSSRFDVYIIIQPKG
jgi:16S rRNA (guanine1516-N2)-methyltransferase